MIKLFAYIVLLLILTPFLSLAKRGGGTRFSNEYNLRYINNALTDTGTIKNAKQHQDPDDKKKIKEIARARRQPKPEKIDQNNGTPVASKTKQKPKRQQRPQGLERPPEIPRRNGG